jgi:hypothetical protein
MKSNEFVNLTEEQYKRLLIDAICKYQPANSQSECVELEKRGLAKFNGNQWNESWAWKSDALRKMPIIELETIYKQYLTNL